MRRTPTSILAARGRERLVAGIALAAGVAIVVVLVTGAGSGSPAKAGSGGGGGPAGSATVERRDLIETDTESGTLSYAGSRTVYDRLSGTITWLPQVGQVIKPGQALYRVDGQPVILLSGSTPAYRDLGPSDTGGHDIEELNRDLVALGYTGYGIVADDQWQSATTAAVEAFQQSVGQPVTGTLTLGQIAFLPGDQLVSTVDATLGATGGGSGSGSATGARANVAAPAPEFVDLTTSTPTTPTTPTTTTPTTPTTSTTPATKPPSPRSGKKKKKGSQNAKTLAALLALLRAETEQLAHEQHSPSGAGSPGSGGAQGNGSNGSGSHGGTGGTGGSGQGGGSGGSGASGGSGGTGGSGSGSGSGAAGGGGGGGGGGSASPILETTSTNLVVTVDLDATKQSEAVVGEPVTVELPDGSSAPGRVTQVSPVAQVSSSSGSDSGGGPSGSGSGAPSATIPVTITLKGRRHRLRGLDHAAVSVEFEQQKARHVLSVPVTALLATAGGGYSVQEAVAAHRLIPVKVGLFAAGYVQISGPGIHAGLPVTDSQG